MFKNLLCFLMLGSFLPSVAEELNLDCAWERVMAYSPTLGVAESDIEICQAGKWQARLRPNPIFTIEGDNLGVPGQDRGAEPPQVTYALSQLVELGGKRWARFALASCEKEGACIGGQITLCDVRLAFLQSYITAAFAQEKLKLAQELERNGASLIEALQCQLCNEKISPILLKREQIHYQSILILLREAEANLTVAYQELASFWGGGCDFDTVCFDLYECPQPPPCSDSFTWMNQTPDYACIENQIRLAHRDLIVQRSFRIPDINFTVGLRTFCHSHAHGLVVGADFPIPCLNRNQGNIERACKGICRAEYLLEEWVQEWHEKVAVLCERLAADYDASNLLRTGMLCDVYEAFELTQNSYQQGKGDYFELLEAEKCLFEIEERYLDILYRYHLNQAELGRYMGFYGQI